MPNQLLALHEFFPVGQGLFASGTVGYRDSTEPECRWVYDCGTVSGNEYIAQALYRLEVDASWQSHSKPKLDLVVVSHFDADHISGIASLLKRFRVGTLMLPFTHLDQRLRAMFATREYTRISAQNYYVDPVGTLATIEGAEIGQIVLVPMAGPDSSVPSDTGADPLKDDPNSPIDVARTRLTLSMDFGEPANNEEQREFDLANAGASTQGIPVRMMRRDSSARYLDQWEFAPFNDPTVVLSSDAIFLAAVEVKRAQLLDKGTAVGRKRAIAALKKLYDDRFGSGATARNIISLFLYAGPIQQRSLSTSLGNTPSASDGMDCVWSCPSCWRDRFLSNSLDQSDYRTGFLYSGDGYLEKPSRWHALLRYYGSARLDYLVGFQVMHHGAERNWHKGIAEAISPGISVFSSDPGRGNTYHPHEKVRADFLPYRPVHANTSTGVQIRTVYR